MIKIYAQNPNEKAVARVADVLRSDGVIVYPTDSVYAFGCSIRSPKAIERLRALSGKKGDEFSIVCPDLSTISAYARVDNAVFKVLKRNLPGPFTFVLNASGKVPDKFLEKRKTVGVRIPDHAVALAIVEALGHPLVTASVKDSEEEYTTDPSLIEERYGSAVDAVIDGGYGLCVPTTVVDCTDESDIVVLREGIGELV
ncbi:L-threonylcarbamoyladenylate synthase [uncultured Alistipes sp.]|uniref:L-threonylcarbamoyladenylate synthase n=1 Tax=uncultured Alistipes sp. TaxID=538949 RepID=UPI002598D81F|nr:L-threonylcarbamoyladenylate synthase [uncultured Alistipes sp.]